MGKKKIVLIVIVILMVVGCILIFPKLSKLDISTSSERAFRFCENNNMVLDIIGINKYFRCIKIEKNIIIEDKRICYIEGIHDWTFCDDVHKTLQEIKK